MRLAALHLLAAAALVTPAACAQAARTTNDPFPQLIVANEGVITVNYTEFATIPGIAGQPQAPRMMLLIDEPGTRRLFVNDMRGPLYSVSYDGKTVTPYVDINASSWGVNVNSQGSERGFQSFAFHPQFSQRGMPGYGKFYTLLDTANTMPPADFAARWHPHARFRSARVDREGRRSQHLRWRSPTRAHPLGTALRQPQLRPHLLQPARGTRRSRLRSSLSGIRRRRQRRRSVQARAEPRHRFWKNPAHQSAGQ